jgi:hypothetical protein
MKYLAMLIVGSLAMACHSGKSPSYAAPIAKVSADGDQHRAEQSKLSALRDRSPSRPSAE